MECFGGQKQRVDGENRRELFCDGGRSMPKTAVGLFEKPDLVDGVVREIEALGFPRKEVRTLTVPATSEVTGVMSFPRLDFEVDQDAVQDGQMRSVLHAPGHRV
jgi:hypothetical protein